MKGHHDRMFAARINKNNSILYVKSIGKKTPKKSGKNQEVKGPLRCYAIHHDPAHGEIVKSCPFRALF